MEIKLTSDSDALICLLYKSYLESRKRGNTREKSKLFGSVTDIKTNFVPNWLEDDIFDCCIELRQADLISYIVADNSAFHINLTNSGIIYMEERFENKVNSILEYIGKIKSLISPL
ncbi:MAG: hypothetical protein U0O22_05245 [Acutalibacteraceae bacterium]